MKKITRFEVFKRDNFKCQYCGKNPPDIILEVDHVIPKSKGGDDDINNLTTSCFDCNRGKKNIPLDVLPISIIENAKILKEQKKQTEYYYRYLDEINQQKEDILKSIGHYFFNKFQKTKRTHDRYIFAGSFKVSIKMFLKIFNKYQIMEAVDIAFNNMQRKNKLTESNVFSYACGILHNWKKQKCQTE